jgi:hypothetical protein
MVHPLVEQLRFTRSEWLRALSDVSAEDAERRLLPMNSISWMVGHLAWQENLAWVIWGQGKNAAPDLAQLVGFGRPASTPSLAAMWTAWRVVTEAANPLLETLTSDRLQEPLGAPATGPMMTYGSMLRRVTYHYWYHIGESQAARQLLGHKRLPDFVGNIDEEAPYRPEAGS